MIFLPQTPIPAKIESILDSASCLRGASYGITVSSEGGEILYTRDGDRRLVPASNQKILSTLYGMYVLGPGYQPSTKIWSRKDKILVSTDGNPMLTSKELRSVTQVGWNKNRPVYVYQAYEPGVPETWELDDLPNKYAAQVFAFTVDRGSFELKCEGGQLAPIPSEFGVYKTWVPSEGSADVSYDPMRHLVTVKGRLPGGSSTLDTLALPEPHKAAAKILGSAYYRLSSVPEVAPDRVLTGPPMSVLAAECLQPSDNQYAEQILLMASHQQGYSDAVKPYDQARKRLKAFLTDVVGLDPLAVNPYDGSGMSRHNQITTNGISKMLSWSTRQSWGDSYRSALAFPGTGTLKNRLSGSSFQGKTGTLNSVNALSGFLITKSGQRLIFSMIVNNTIESSSTVRDTMDKIIRSLEDDSQIGTRLE